MSDALDLVAELVQRESGIRLQPVQYPALRAAIVARAADGEPPPSWRSPVTASTAGERSRGSSTR